MSKLSDVLAAGPSPDPRHKCGLDEWLETLDSDDRLTAEAALNDSRWTANELTGAFRSAGFPLGSNVVSRHRRKDCACGRTE